MGVRAGPVLSGSCCPLPLPPEPPGAMVSLAGGASGRQQSSESSSRWLCMPCGYSAPVQAGELTSQGVLCVKTPRPRCDTVRTAGSLLMVSMETPHHPLSSVSEIKT